MKTAVEIVAAAAGIVLFAVVVVIFVVVVVKTAATSRGVPLNLKRQILNPLYPPHQSSRPQSAGSASERNLSFPRQRGLDKSHSFGFR